MLGHAVSQIWRQFVEQNQGRLLADQFLPVLLVRRLRAALVEFGEFVGLAELLGDVAPQMPVARDRPTGDRDDPSLRGLESFDDFLRNQMREAWIRAQIADREHGMGLAATHRLLEFEHGLTRLAGEPLEALTQQRAHAAGDVGFPEERLRCPRLMVDEIVQAFDLVTERVVDRLGVEFAGVPNRL